jgi:hypothetical protein
LPWERLLLSFSKCTFLSSSNLELGEKKIVWKGDLSNSVPEIEF